MSDDIAESAALLAVEMERIRLTKEIDRLRAALEPFARNVKSLSLGGALGHITREDLWRARDVLCVGG